MFIPRYWAEASHREVFPGRRQVTVRRFGWSSESQEDAEVHARQRVEEAAAVLRDRGPNGLRDFTRRERVVAYSGSDGLPIREEIVEEHPHAEAVVTRNSYGALCLNAKSAMFVDVDRPEGGAGCLLFLGTLLGAVAAALALPRVSGLSGVQAGLLGALVFALIGILLTLLAQRTRLQNRDPLAWTIAQVESWCEERRHWLVKVYATPNGARLLPLHSPFDAGEESTYEFMDHVGVDPLYKRMCRIQKCFRARVSPKPWRAGIRDHFKAGGTWPVRDPGKLSRREAWVRVYESEAQDYASCRAVDTIGRGRPDPAVDEVRRIHDEMCRADSRLEIA